MFNLPPQPSNNDKNSSKQDNPHHHHHQTHRALIFQGGGALGAYEAGIYKALYDNLIEKSINENRQLFDIVAGYIRRSNKCNVISKSCITKQK